MEKSQTFAIIVVPNKNHYIVHCVQLRGRVCKVALLPNSVLNVDITSPVVRPITIRCF